MLSSMYTRRKKYILFLLFFEKFNLVSKLLLSAVCFSNLFEIRIMNYFRAVDSPVSFFETIRVLTILIILHLSLSNVFNNKYFCGILFLLVTVV